MACAWENKRRAVEVCPLELGNYMYIWFGPSGTQLVEVAKDLSGYTSAFPGGDFPSNPTLYSKRQNVYAAIHDTSVNPPTVTISRFDGSGDFTPVSGVPTGLAAENKRILYTGGKLRAINSVTGFVASLYESDDGETWTVLPGSVTYDGSFPLFFGEYTILGSRIVAVRAGVLGGSGGPKRLVYSDDGGATWTDGAGSADSSGGNRNRNFVHSGSNLIVHADELYVGTDGATWTQITALFNNSDAWGSTLAANGEGRVVAAGTHGSSGLPGVAWSSNHGNSWSVREWPAAGVSTPGQGATPLGLFWDGAQFVVFVQRHDLGIYQIYTSPTGADWTEGLVIPQIDAFPTQIID